MKDLRSTSVLSGFLLYAVTCWEYHLQCCGHGIENTILDLLEKLFTGRAVLVWIYLISPLKQLSLLKSTANTSCTMTLKVSSIKESKRLMIF